MINKAIYQVQDFFTDATVLPLDTANYQAHMNSVFTPINPNYLTSMLSTDLVNATTAFMMFDGDRDIKFWEYNKQPICSIDLKTSTVYLINDFVHLGNNVCGATAPGHVIFFGNSDNTYVELEPQSFISDPADVTYQVIDTTVSPNDKFGFSKDSHDGTIYVVGAPDGQYVKIFLQQNGSFVEIDHIDSTDASFGYAVSITSHECDSTTLIAGTEKGNALAVGAPEVGKIFLYKKMASDATFSYVQTYVYSSYSNVGATDRFGENVILIPRFYDPSFSSLGWMSVFIPRANYSAAQGYYDNGLQVRVLDTWDSNGNPSIDQNFGAGLASTTDWNDQRCGQTAVSYYRTSTWVYRMYFCPFILCFSDEGSTSTYVYRWRYDQHVNGNLQTGYSHSMAATKGDPNYDSSQGGYAMGLKTLYGDEEIGLHKYVFPNGKQVVAVAHHYTSIYTQCHRIIEDPTGNYYGGFGDFAGADGKYVYIANPRETINGYDNCGAIYVYNYAAFLDSSSNLNSIYKIVPETPAANLFFGHNIMVDKETGVQILSFPDGYHSIHDLHFLDNEDTYLAWDCTNFSASTDRYGRIAATTTAYANPKGNWTTTQKYAPKKFAMSWHGSALLASYPSTLTVTIKNHTGTVCFNGTVNNNWPDGLYEHALDLSGGYLGEIAINNSSGNIIRLTRLEFYEFGDYTSTPSLKQNEFVPAIFVDYTADFTGIDLDEISPEYLICLQDSTHVRTRNFLIETRDEIIAFCEEDATGGDTTGSFDATLCQSYHRSEYLKDFNLMYNNPGLNSFYFAHDHTGAYKYHPLMSIELRNKQTGIISNDYVMLPIEIPNGSNFQFYETDAEGTSHQCPWMHLGHLVRLSEIVSTENLNITTGDMDVQSMSVLTWSIYFDEGKYFTTIIQDSYDAYRVGEDPRRDITEIKDQNGVDVPFTIRWPEYPPDIVFPSTGGVYQYDLTADYPITELRITTTDTYMNRDYLLFFTKDKKPNIDSAILTIKGDGDPITVVPTYHNTEQICFKRGDLPWPEYGQVKDYKATWRNYYSGVLQTRTYLLWYPPNEALSTNNTWITEQGAFSHLEAGTIFNNKVIEFDIEELIDPLPPLLLFGWSNTREEELIVKYPVFLDVQQITYQVDATTDQTTIDDMLANYHIRINGLYFDGTAFIDSTEYNTLGEIVDLTGSDFTGIFGHLTVDMTPGPDPYTNLLTDFRIKGVAVYVDDPQKIVGKRDTFIRELTNYINLDTTDSEVIVKLLEGELFEFWDNELDIQEEKKGTY